MQDGWIRTERGTLRKVYRARPPSARPASFPTPRLIRDFDEPVQSMADGQFYTSKRALARSARAAHNPHGQDFIELGTEEALPFVEHKTDERAERETIKQAISDFENGWRPEVVALDD